MEEKRESLIEASSVLGSKLAYLDGYLLPLGLSLSNLFGLDEKAIRDEISEPKKTGWLAKCRRKSYLRKVARYFYLDEKLLLDDSIGVDELPKYEDLKIPQLLFKIKTLHQYLLDNYQLSLDRAISISERALNEIISGERKPSKSFLNKVSDYFSLPLHILLNDEEELPLDKLVIDKDLVSIQRKDIENELQRHKEKRSFKRNWLILSHGSRIRVVLTSLAVILPLLAYTAYCSYILIEDRVSTTSEYVAEQSLSEEEEKIIENQEALLAKEEKSYQVTVDIGINVAKITNVSNSGMSFSPTMQLFFDR